MIFQDNVNEILRPYEDGKSLYSCTQFVGLEVLDSNPTFSLKNDCSMELVSTTLKRPVSISPFIFGSRLWGKWAFDFVTCCLEDSKGVFLRGSRAQSLLDYSENPVFRKNRYGVRYYNKPGKPKCTNVLAWSEFCKPGFGLHVINQCISSLINQLTSGINFTPGHLYHIKVQRFELAFDQALGSTELMFLLYLLYQEKLDENPIYGCQRPAQYQSPFTQFTEMKGEKVMSVKRIKLYPKTTGEGGAILRFEYAWDSSSRCKPPTEPIFIDLIARKVRNSVMLLTPEDRPAAAALRDTLLQKGLEGFFPIWLFLSQPMK